MSSIAYIIGNLTAYVNDCHSNLEKINKGSYCCLWGTNPIKENLAN